MRNKSSIAEERTSARRKLNAKSKVKGSVYKLTLDYYVVHPTPCGIYKCYHNRQLPNGTLAAHTNTYLSLLPPGPDEVRKIYVAQEPFVQHLLLWASPTEDALGREFIPNIADLWLQDAATFPTSTWRREGDSNPWYAYHVYPLSRRAPSTNSTISPRRLFYKVFNLT